LEAPDGKQKSNNAFLLTDAYPNPFNSVIKILYELPIPSPVTIRIYNIAGQLISTLVNSEQSAGNYYTEWNGNKFSSGIYLVRIDASDFRVARRLILAK